MLTSICVRALLGSVWLSLSTACVAWQVASRELVDVQFAANDSLVILVTGPGATVPGIYVWRPNLGADTGPGEVAPKLQCSLSHPASFSFDRKTIIERTTGEQRELRIYDPATCRLRGRLPAEGRVIDADVNGKHVAVALQFASGTDPQYELRSYTLNGRMLARAALGRNTEMGFAPDGRSVLNFDLSDGAALAWTVPTLARTSFPEWAVTGETTFIPGSSLVKRYVDTELSVVHWPSGKRHFATNAPRSVRVRQLSRTGRFGVLHTQDSAGEGLDWLDFVTAKRARIATGSIDNAAINGNGALVAWALRRSGTADQVEIHLMRVGATERTHGRPL